MPRIRFSKKVVHPRGSFSSSAAMIQPVNLQPTVEDELKLPIDPSITNVLRDLIDMVHEDTNEMQERFQERHRQLMQQKNDAMAIAFKQLRDMSANDEMSLKLSQTLENLRVESKERVKSIYEGCLEMKPRLQVLHRTLVQQRLDQCKRVLNNIRDVLQRRYNETSFLIDRHNQFTRELDRFMLEMAHAPESKKLLKVWGLRALIGVFLVGTGSLFYYGQKTLTALTGMGFLALGSAYPSQVKNIEETYKKEMLEVEEQKKMWLTARYQVEKRKESLGRMIHSMDSLIQGIGDDLEIIDLFQDEEEAKDLFAKGVNGMQKLRLLCKKYLDDLE